MKFHIKLVFSQNAVIHHGLRLQLCYWYFGEGELDKRAGFNFKLIPNMNCIYAFSKKLSLVNSELLKSGVLDQNNFLYSCPNLLLNHHKIVSLSKKCEFCSLGTGRVYANCCCRLKRLNSEFRIPPVRNLIFPHLKCQLISASRRILIAGVTESFVL